MIRWCVLGLIVGVAIAGYRVAARSDPADLGRCESVAPEVAEGIASGLTVSGGGSLRAIQAVRSADYEQVWFVGAEIQGPGMEGGGEVAVFAVNHIDADFGMVIVSAADGYAEQFTGWGDAPGPGLIPGFDPGPSDDGFGAAKDCTKALLSVHV